MSLTPEELETALKKIEENSASAREKQDEYRTATREYILSDAQTLILSAGPAFTLLNNITSSYPTDAGPVIAALASLNNVVRRVDQALKDETAALALSQQQNQTLPASDDSGAEPPLS